MKVQDVMHSGVTWVPPDMPVLKIAKKMRDEDIGAVPVGENDKLIGMVKDRDIACRALADGKDIAALTARDVMSKPILYCQADEDVQDAVRIMETKKIRRLPVINAKKRMVGMLALGDISQKMPQSLAGEVIRAVSAHHD
jgi:predicted transcriptional regulator